MQEINTNNHIYALAVLALTAGGLLSSNTALGDDYFTIRNPENPNMCANFGTSHTGNGSSDFFQLSECHDNLTFSTFSYFEQVGRHLIFASDELLTTRSARDWDNGRTSFRNEAECLTVREGWNSWLKKKTWELRIGMYTDQRIYPDNINRCDGWQVGEVIRSEKYPNLCLSRGGLNQDEIYLDTCDGSAGQRWLIHPETPSWANTGEPGTGTAGTPATAAAGQAGASPTVPSVAPPPADPNERDARGDTLLHRLVRAGDIEGIKDALARGGDPTIQNNSGSSPAEEAARLENGDEILALLLGDSASGSMSEGSGMNVMASLISRSAGVEAVAAALASSGRMTNSDFDRLARNEKYNSLRDDAIIAVDDPSAALTTAVSMDDLHFVTKVMALRSVKPTGRHITTALQRASLPVLISLLENDAPPDPVLSRAIYDQDIDLAELAIQYGATPTQKQMQEATRIGNSEIVTLLVSVGGDGEEAMTRAIDAGDKATIDQLVSTGVIISKKEYFKNPVRQQDLAMIRFLIERGGSVQHAMEQAISQCSVDMVRRLYDEFDVMASARHLTLALGGGTGCPVKEVAGVVIDNGADPQAGMMMAIQRGGYDGASRGSTIQFLVERGADGRPRELMDYAISNENWGSVTQLLKLGAKVPPTLDDGRSVFHKVFENCAERTSSLISELIKAGIDGLDINARAPGSGDTPLHVAARNPKCSYWMDDFIGSAKFYESDRRVGNAKGEVTLYKGVGPLEINARNNAGKTPRSVARGKRNKKILKSHGAR